MKLQGFLLTVVCLIFGCASVFAQLPGNNPQSAPPPGEPGVSGSGPQSSGQTNSNTANTQNQNNQTPAVQEPDPSKVKHDGGENDVDAVGNRKIGGRGLGNWYSLETDIKMGKQYAQMVDSSSKLINDPVVTEYVNRLGQNLVRNSDAQVPFTFKVIDSDVLNAFSLPGGFVYINTGTILAADEEAELAGVMAHEIGHVCARHATRQLTRSQYAGIATIPLIFVGGGLGYIVYEASGLGLPVAFMSFQRGFEAEADYLGIQYMYKAGYDPNSYVAFFGKVMEVERRMPGSMPSVFMDHPPTGDRVVKSEEEIKEILPKRDQYLVSTSEFDDVKARLQQVISNRKKLKPGDSGPTLRKREPTDQTTTQTQGTGSGSGSGSSSGDDQPPVLKRRD